MMLKWTQGRQGDGYAKMLLAQSRRFKWDCYLLRFEPLSYVPEHTDPAPPGFTHWRWNFVLKGEGDFIYWPKDMTRSFIDSTRHIRFPASEIRHAYNNGPARTYMLSIGWLRRVKHER